MHKCTECGKEMYYSCTYIMMEDKHEEMSEDYYVCKDCRVRLIVRLEIDENQELIVKEWASYK